MSLKDRKKFEPVAVAVCAVCALTLGVLSWQQNKVWSDPVTFFSNIIASGELAVKAHTNLGAYYSQAGDYRQAAQQYDVAIKNSGDTVAALQHDIGVNLMMANSDAMNDEALAHFQRALQIDADYYPTLKLLADYYARQGDQAQAAQYQTRADTVRRRYKTLSDSSQPTN